VHVPPSPRVQMSSTLPAVSKFAGMSALRPSAEMPETLAPAVPELLCLSGVRSGLLRRRVSEA
jgi:hypothetical protein